MADPPPSGDSSKLPAGGEESDSLRGSLGSPHLQERQWQGFTDGAVRSILIIWLIAAVSVALVVGAIGAFIHNGELVAFASGGGVFGVLLPLLGLVYRRYFSPVNQPRRGRGRSNQGP